MFQVRAKLFTFGAPTKVNPTLEATQGQIVPPQPSGKLMVSLFNSRTNATKIGWHLREIDFRFAPWLPLGWLWRREWRRM